jgi:hypothetical protein
MRERLTTAIKDLPERERPVLNLSYYEELTHFLHRQTLPFVGAGDRSTCSHALGCRACPGREVPSIWPLGRPVVCHPLCR